MSLMLISKMVLLLSSCLTMLVVRLSIGNIYRIEPLKIENPFDAAQRFLNANELPLSYVDEVVKFIEQNTKSATIGQSTEEYSDPFTGKLSLSVNSRQHTN